MSIHPLEYIYRTKSQWIYNSNECLLELELCLSLHLFTQIYFFHYIHSCFSSFFYFFVAFTCFFFCIYYYLTILLEIEFTTQFTIIFDAHRMNKKNQLHNFSQKPLKSVSGDFYCRLDTTWNPKKKKRFKKNVHYHTYRVFSCFCYNSFFIMRVRMLSCVGLFDFVFSGFP